MYIYSSDCQNGLVHDVENIFSYCGQFTALLNHLLNMANAWNTKSVGGRRLL